MKGVWEEMPLGELCDVLDQKRKPITKRDRVAGEYPYYGATGVLDHVAGFLFDEPLVLVGEDGAKWGSGEKTAFSVEGKIWVNNHAHVLRPHRDKLLDDWLIYYLNHSDLSAYVTGLTVPKLNQGRLREISIPLPPLPEQQRIVTLLEEAFDGLATAKANAERNLHSARDIFSAHLNQILGNAGDDWTDASFGDVVVRSRGGISIKSTEYSDTGIPVLTKGDIKPLGKVEHGGKYVQEELVEEKRWPLADPGDLIVATRDLKPSAPFLGLVSRVPPDRAYLINQGATYFKVDDSSVIPEYFIYWCCCTRYREHIVARKSGSTQVHIRESDLFSAPLAVPPIDIQRSIVANLNELREEHERLALVYERKLVALDELKQSLLHKACSGEI